MDRKDLSEREEARYSLRLLGILGLLAGTGMCALLLLALSAALLLRPVASPSAPTREPDFSSTTVILITPIPEVSLPPVFVATAGSTPAIPEPAPQAADGVTPLAALVTLESSGCPAPEGWEVHYVEPGETLFAYVLGAISTGTTITTRDVRSANCLTSDLLQIGQMLYLPADAAENAPPSEPVGAPAGVASSGPRAPMCDPHCTISIRPGWRAEQIAAVIDSTPVGFWGADFLGAIASAGNLPSYAFLASRPSTASLEGFLLPGTYELANHTTAADFRDMLLAAFAAAYSGDMEFAASAQGLTFYQAVILASVIQRESWAPSEQVLISSVFHNRLRAGVPLGASVTTQYALGGPGNWWPRVAGGQINAPSPYNTNLNPGLPPAPIDSPGIDALRAALYPAVAGYMYFTGNCQGPGNLYATTYDEHLANVTLCR
jgi:hypothetical protein